MDYGWIWVIVIIAAIIIEIVTDQLISIWFVPGGITAVILDFVKVDLVWQILVFLLLSIVGVVFAKLFLTKFIHTEKCKTNIDAIIGEKCIVTEKIDNFAGCGQVKVKGQIWSARGVGEDDIYEADEILQVVAIEGVKVICKKK